MEHLDGGVLHRPVHPLGLAVRLGMIGPGQLVSDPVLAADPVEDMPHPGRRRPVAVLGQIGECHAVVGQDRVHGIREDGVAAACANPSFWQCSASAVNSTPVTPSSAISLGTAAISSGAPASSWWARIRAASLAKALST